MRLVIHRTGAGAALVLLHALGSSSHSWEPLVPVLAERFEVITVELPGFGRSPALAPSVEPTPAVLAAAVSEALDEAGVGAAHVVGNSIGGWVALELARLRPMATLTLLSPAGLWKHDTPVYCRVSLAGTHWLAQNVAGVLDRAVRTRLGRTVVLGQSHGQPWRVTPPEASAAIAGLGTCPGFTPTLRATIRRHYEDSGGRLLPPTTVAFGGRDLILLSRRWRRLDELPDDVVVRQLPGCGHIPMYDDPAGVAALIMASTVAG